MPKHFIKYLKVVVQPVWGHHPFMAVCARCARFYGELQLWFISFFASVLQPDKRENRHIFIIKIVHRNSGHRNRGMRINLSNDISTFGSTQEEPCVLFLTASTRNNPNNLAFCVCSMQLRCQPPPADMSVSASAEISTAGIVL